jgi:hypothetical protein
MVGLISWIFGNRPQPILQSKQIIQQKKESCCDLEG